MPDDDDTPNDNDWPGNVEEPTQEGMDWGSIIDSSINGPDPDDEN